MLQEKNIIIQGLNIRYYKSSDIEKNNTLVFLHGWGSEASHFQKSLEKCKSFLAVDLPGFGGSEEPNFAWTLSDYADFIKDFLKKLDIKNPIIAGHSFGGSIGIKYCTQENDVKKLILIDSAGIRKKTATNYGKLAVAKIFGLFLSLPGLHSIKSATRKWFYKRINSEDYANAGSLKGTYKKVIKEDLRKDLEKINTKTIIIWGENDNDTPAEDGKLMHQLIKGSELHIIPGAGHYVFLDNEKAFNEIFLSNIK